jgi:uncharacterized protein with GYD domain
MAISITQDRYTKDGLKGMIATPEDCTEAMSRLLGQVGGVVIAYYLASGDYDYRMISERPLLGAGYTGNDRCCCWNRSFRF